MPVPPIPLPQLASFLKCNILSTLIWKKIVLRAKDYLSSLIFPALQFSSISEIVIVQYDTKNTSKIFDLTFVAVEFDNVAIRDCRDSTSSFCTTHYEFCKLCVFHV